METGLLNMEKYRFDFVDAGAVEMSMQIDGYTEELARNVSRIANEINQDSDSTSQQNAGMELLAAITPLAINGIRISVEDNSLLNKILNQQAVKLNQKPEQLAQFVGPMLSVIMAPYQIPEFAGSVTQAVNTFMQGNKKITVSAQPKSGLAVTEIMSLASGFQAGSVSPAELIERLDLQVTTE